MKEKNSLELSKGLLPEEQGSSIKINKQGTLKTIIIMTNNIVGSTILILPNLNMKSGIITVQIVSLVIGIITFHTCDMFISHMREEEHDVTDVLKRVLGKKWANAFGVVSGIANIIFCMGIFVLMCNMFYAMCTFIFSQVGYTDFAPKFEVTFSAFSFQYATLIASLPCIFAVFLKDINIIIKFAQFGIVPLASFFIFILYVLGDNLASGRVVTADINLFTWNIHEVGGIFAIAYFFHTAAPPVAKTNHKPENNTRDLFISYIASWLIYSMIGCFGYFGVMGRECQKANNIMDFFGNDSPFAFFIQIIFFFKLISIYPILAYAGRTQLLSIIKQRGEEIPAWKGNLYNVVLLGMSLAVALPCANPAVIIAFNGAITGFVLIYIFPIKMHLQCIIKSTNITEHFELTKDQESYSPENSQLSGKKCVDHSWWTGIPRRKLYLFYSFLIVLGFTLMILQIVMYFTYEPK